MLSIRFMALVTPTSQNRVTKPVAPGQDAAVQTQETRLENLHIDPQPDQQNAGSRLPDQFQPGGETPVIIPQAEGKDHQAGNQNPPQGRHRRRADQQSAKDDRRYQRHSTRQRRGRLVLFVRQSARHIHRPDTPGQPDGQPPHDQRQHQPNQDVAKQVRRENERLVVHVNPSSPARA
jgi:hypothetical protein